MLDRVLSVNSDMGANKSGHLITVHDSSGQAVGTIDTLDVSVTGRLSKLETGVRLVFDDGYVIDNPPATVARRSKVLKTWSIVGHVCR